MALPAFRVGLPTSVTPLWKPPHSQPQVSPLGNSKSSHIDNGLIFRRQSTYLSWRLLSCTLCYCSGKTLFPGHCRFPASRFLTQKEATVVCPAEVFQGSPAGCGQGVPETFRVSTPHPSLPDDDVFLEEAETPPPQDSHGPQGLPTR